MEKKSMQKSYEFLSDGKPASLLEIAEKSGDEQVWRSFLEGHGLSRSISASADRYLEDKLGKYLSANDISSLTEIKNSVLNKWRKRGILQAIQLRGRWYYSIKSLLYAIKSADLKDIKS